MREDPANIREFAEGASEQNIDDRARRVEWKFQDRGSGVRQDRAAAAVRGRAAI
jgi:hypothetical protein